MSNTVFGVPPPPRPHVLESPGGTPRVGRPGTGRSPRPVVVRTKEPRRRLVIVLALLAAPFLLLANVGSWLHLHALDASSAAGPAASASSERARTEIRAVAEPALLAELERYYDASGTPVPANAGPAVTAAVDEALASPEFTALWEDAVRQALEIEIATVDQGGDDPSPSSDVTDGTVEVDLSTMAPVAAASLSDAGFTFFAGQVPGLGTYAVPVSSSANLPNGVLHVLDTWWLLLLVAAVAFGVAALVIAQQRLRLGAVLAADVAVMLALTLAGVAVLGQLVGGLADDEGYRGFVEDVYSGVTRALVVQTLVLLVLAVLILVGCLAALASRRRSSPAA